MNSGVCQPPEFSLSLKVLSDFSRAIHAFLSRMESCIEKTTDPLPVAAAVPPSAWEHSLIQTLSASLAQALTPDWVSAVLPEPNATEFHLRPFEGCPTPGMPSWIEPLQQALGSLVKAAGLYRRIAAQGDAMRIETNCQSAEGGWGPAIGSDHAALLTVGVGPRIEHQEDVGCDYSAVAALPSGCTRLLVTRVLGQGNEKAWERLACDAAFRAACALQASPAETVEWMTEVWPAGEGDASLVRWVCCADVADSGREYVFAGTGTHLLYESAPQTVAELFERLTEPPQPSARRVGQRARFHSGDILLLHTFDLPAALPHRHDVLRRLGALLAREGRRPVGEIVPQVESLFRNGSKESSAGSVLVLLRAE